MSRIILIALLVILSGCATAKMGRQITVEQAAWIQKGVTSRSEVVARFGVPNFEFPDYTNSKYETTSTSTTTKDGDTSTTTTTVQAQSPKSTKATYLHTRSEAAVLPFYANVQTTQNQFWINYDEKGIVQDFGFAGGPGLKCASAGHILGAGPLLHCLFSYVRYIPITSVCCKFCLNCSAGNPRTSAIAWTMPRKRS